MRILIVGSFNRNRFAPFIQEQAEALQAAGCEIAFYGLKGKGLPGYLKNMPALKRKVKAFQPDVVHAHYGLSGLLANLQRQVPVVTTYHGSDINERKILPFSKLSMWLSSWNIFVSRKTMDIAQPKKRFSLLPCGINLSNLQLTEKLEARRRMDLDSCKKYVLFAGAFDNAVKNAPLAQNAVALLQDDGVELLELKGYSREEVTLLMCAADVFLMTSVSEGSPQVIKEALACGCPIVSVDVGDVKERIEGIDDCYVAKSGEAKELSGLLNTLLANGKRTKGLEKLIADGLDNQMVARQLVGIYERVVNNEHS